MALVRKLAVSRAHEPGDAHHRRDSPNQALLHAGCLGERTEQGRPLHLRRQGRLDLVSRAKGHTAFRRKHAPVHEALKLLACRVGDLATVAPLARGHFLGQVQVILAQGLLEVPNDPDVLIKGGGFLERAGGALPVDALLRLEVVLHAVYDGALGRLLHPGLQRNAAEPALFREIACRRA